MFDFSWVLIDLDGVVPDISENTVDDVNVLCGLLKLYFRMLPIPIITFDLYDQFVDAVSKCLRLLVSVLTLNST